MLLVAAQQLRRTLEAPSPLAGLLLQQVGAERLPAEDPAGTGDFEALGRAPVGLHLGHRDLRWRGWKKKVTTSARAGRIRRAESGRRGASRRPPPPRVVPHLLLP